MLNGATVLHMSAKAEDRARLAGQAGHDLPSFQDAFLKMVQKLRRIAANAQQKLRQPTPANSVRFLEPPSRPDSSRQSYIDVDASSSGSAAAVLSQQVDAAYPDLLTPRATFQRPAAEPVRPAQQPAAALLEAVRGWQAVHQPGAPLATSSSLLALTQQMQSQGSSLGQHEPASQFGAHSQGYSAGFCAVTAVHPAVGAAAEHHAFRLPVRRLRQCAPWRRRTRSWPRGWVAPDAIGAADPWRSTRRARGRFADAGRGSRCPVGAGQGVAFVLQLPGRRAAQGADGGSVPKWYSAAPFAGFAALQDIMPHLAVLERVSISEHALTFPPHNEKAFKQNLASYGMSRCDTLEKTLENVYWFSLAGTGQVTMETATSKALAILLSACEVNKDVAKRSATLNQASRKGGEAGLLLLIRLLDDELLPVSKQKATQEFKDLTAGDDDKLADGASELRATSASAAARRRRRSSRRFSTCSASSARGGLLDVVLLPRG